MKKIIILMILILVGFQSWGQGDPIAPYNTGRTIREFRSFVISGNELSYNFRKEMVSIIRENLSNAGKPIALDQSNIYWILKKIKFKSINIKEGYVYSRRVGNEIKFFDKGKEFNGMVGVFKLKKYELILFKVDNLSLIINAVEKTEIDYVTKIQPRVREKRDRPSFLKQVVVGLFFPRDYNYNYGGYNSYPRPLGVICTNCRSYRYNYLPYINISPKFYSRNRKQRKISITRKNYSVGSFTHRK